MGEARKSAVDGVIGRVVTWNECDEIGSTTSAPGRGATFALGVGAPPELIGGSMLRIG